jgi:hypothetical protein
MATSKKDPDDLAVAKRLMGALLRMPPRQHDDMKLTKGKRRVAAKKKAPPKRG